MKNLKVKTIGDMTLREHAKPVGKITPDLLETLDSMAKIMDSQRGIGLAAPQVGILERFIVIREVKNRKDLGVLHKMLNPEIIKKSAATACLEEGCLSVLGPDNLPIFAEVERPETILVKWTDETGKKQEREFSGLGARVILHETDHLDGILFVDYLSSAKREMVMRKVKKRKGATN